MNIIIIIIIIDHVIGADNKQSESGAGGWYVLV
jgi:hypothetical protein